MYVGTLQLLPIAPMTHLLNPHSQTTSPVQCKVCNNNVSPASDVLASNSADGLGAYFLDGVPFLQKLCKWFWLMSPIYCFSVFYFR